MKPSISRNNGICQSNGCYSDPARRHLLVVLLWAALGASQGVSAQVPREPSVRELEALILGLRAEAYSDRMAATKALLAAAEERPAVFACNFLRESRKNGDPEIRQRCGELVKDVYLRWVVGVGESDLGAKFGWFVQYDGKSVSTLPLVIEVAKGGPADQAGLKPGDAITHLDEVPCRALDGRGGFTRMLVKIPAGQAISLRVKRGGSDDPFLHDEKMGDETLKVVPKKRNLAEFDGSEAEQGFQVWLKSLENRIH